MGWYRFGSFQIDLDAFALHRGDEVIPMQRKVFDVLCHLVENRGRVVTKAELLSELWRNEHVNEGAVAWSVSHIRRALGQQRGDRQPIETVQGRGYRFVADVETGDSVPAARRPAPQLPPRASNFVGRARVMAELEQHVRDAARGQGGLCVLTGEAGIGKTRCADELVAVAGALGVQTLIGRCPQEPAAPPLWPVAAALRSVADDYPELATRARELLAHHGEEDSGDSERASSARFWLIERAAHLLRDVAAIRPTLLILDDLHWADTTSLGLLGFIAQELRELALCIVVTLRDGERQPGSHEPLQRLLRHAHTIPLRALDSGQVGELIEKLSGERPSDALAEAARRAAGGIPLFVQEVVRSLVLEHGASALPRLPPDAVRPPELARDLLRQRVHRLPPATIALLSQAAVIGDTFDLSLLLSLVELEPEVLLDRLEPAIAEGQLESDAPHTYRFVHSLFQAVLYDDLLASERVAIHRKLAALLDSRSDEDARIGEIARHLYLSLPAGDYVTVMERARAAGKVAAQQFAFEDAARYYTWALEAQAFGGAADPRLRAELLLSLASAQRLSGRTLEATQTTARVLDLAQQHRLHDAIVRATRLRRPTVAMWMVPDPLARSALEGVLAQLPEMASTARVSALAQLACIPPYDRDLARSKELSNRAVTLANELQAPEAQVEAMRARLFALSGPDDIDEVLRVVEQMQLLDRARRGGRTGDALGAAYLAHVMAGRMAEADAALQRMLAGIGDRPLPEARFYCERLLAQRLFLDGHFDEAEQRWHEVRTRALRGGLPYADMFWQTQRFNLALEREGPRVVLGRRFTAAAAINNATPVTRASAARVDAEAGELERARRELSSLGDPSDYPRDGHYLNLLANMAACACLVDDKPRCEQLAVLLGPYAALNTPTPMGYYLGAVAHFLGLLAQALGKPAQARSHFEHALERNRAMGYRPGVVRTLLANGRLAQQQGHMGPARELLERARDEAQALGMRGAVAEANALLGVS